MPVSRPARTEVMRCSRHNRRLPTDKPIHPQERRLSAPAFSRTGGSSREVTAMKRFLPIFTAALCLLTGCIAAPPVSSSSSTPSPTPTPAPQSEASAPSQAFDLHAYYELPDSVVIRDTVDGRTQLPFNGFAMYNLKELFGRLTDGQWEEAEALVCSTPGVFDQFAGVQISDFVIRELEVQDEKTMVYFDLTVEESDNPLFAVGTTPWAAKLTSFDRNWAEYILPQGSSVSTCYFASLQPVEQFCFRLASYLPDLRGTDFSACFDRSDPYVMYQAVDAACVILNSAGLPDVPDTPETNSSAAFCDRMEAVFGVDLRDVDLTQYSGYQAYGMMVPVGKGGRWVYAAIAESTRDEAHNRFTVTMDLYADTVCWVKAQTLRYTVGVNEDGSFRLLEVEQLYDSGHPLEMGSV